MWSRFITLMTHALCGAHQCARLTGEQRKYQQREARVLSPDRRWTLRMAFNRGNRLSITDSSPGLHRKRVTLALDTDDVMAQSSAPSLTAKWQERPAYGLALSPVRWQGIQN
jgi:hypothetical protein